MNGYIVVIGKGVMVSNMATIDIHTDIIDTPEGIMSTKIKVIDIIDPFGKVEKDEIVSVAFKAEDDSKFSYQCTVRQCSETRCVLVIDKLINKYNEIIKEGRAWLV